MPFYHFFTFFGDKTYFFQVKSTFFKNYLVLSNKAITFAPLLREKKFKLLLNFK